MTSTLSVVFVRNERFVPHLKWDAVASISLFQEKRDGKSNFHISFTPSLKSPTGTCEYLVLLWLCRKAYASYYLLACRFLRKPASFISFFLLGNVVGRVLPKFVSTHKFVFFWMIPTYHLYRLYFILELGVVLKNSTYY